MDNINIIYYLCGKSLFCDKLKIKGCKIGSTKYIISRMKTYQTGYADKVPLICYYKIDKNCYEIDDEIKNIFDEYRLRNKGAEGGTEIYDSNIITIKKLEEFFNDNKINFTKYEPSDIDFENYKKRLDKNNINELHNEDIYKVSHTKKPTVVSPKLNNDMIELNNNKEKVPRDYQKIIIKDACNHFIQNDKGMLVLMCGVGKTLISLWITQELKSNTILIGVPNKLLLEQWEYNIKTLFQYIPCLIVESGINKEDITNFLQKNNKTCIIITTYSSSHKIYTATKNINYTFNMKILDEAHHLTSINVNEEERKTYIKILKINSNKQIALTATMKKLENEGNDIVSNENTEYFGKIIDRKCLLWAINENIICDYVIQTIITNKEQLEEQLTNFHITEENDKLLFLSAYTSLKSIFDNQSHHLLIYSNNKNNSLKIIEYIKCLLDDNYFDIPNLYYSSYHSEMKSKDQKEIIDSFDKAKFGIITCVYCLGEGYDNHNIDAVVFAENMGSNIRIVQSALRASRKNNNEPNKITKIILPILNKYEWLENNNNSDLKKVREVIYQMGLEDETITQKIKVFNIEVKKYNKSIVKKYIDDIDNFGDYDEELTTNLRLKTIKRTTLGTSYENARKIIASKNIKNKEKYFELCKKDNRLSIEPELTYNGQFTNWIEYLSIEKIYYDLETCIEKVNELLILHNEIKNHYLDLSIVCKELCELDNNFPPNGLWVEYYNLTDLRAIIIIVNKKKEKGCII